MDDAEFDKALIASHFTLAGERGWARVRVADAARAAGLPLDRARLRFPGCGPTCGTVLLRFGRLADSAALAGLDEAGTPRDRLFDIVMRRIDVLQAHRAGVLALLRALPCAPATAALLAAASLRSMAWLLDGAGIGATGPRGALRAKGLLAVWLWTVRAWQRDTSEDLSATMAALDQALDRAERAEAWLGRRPAAAATPPPEDPGPAIVNS